MARLIDRLTAIEVRRLSEPGLYPDGGGLYLQVSPGGAKSWIYRFTLKGRARAMGLGPHHIVSLAEARNLAREARRLRYERIDPIEQRKSLQAEADLTAAQQVTFMDAARAYIDANKAAWRNDKHKAQWTATLEAYGAPIFGQTPLADIDTNLVLKALQPIWTTKSETASRVRGRIETVLDWATVRGLRTGDNPARWKGHLDKLLPAKSKVSKVEHHAALPYKEVSALMADLRKQRGAGARALEFAILTAARTGEVIGATWNEFDLEHATWTIPAARMKAEKEHRVPLSPAAIAVVSTRREQQIEAERTRLSLMGQAPPNDLGPQLFVFEGMRSGKGLSNMALLKVLERMGRSDLTTHGFRSTFRDWAAEMTEHRGEIVEMALAHTIAGKVEAAYRRGDLLEKRTHLMHDWAQYIVDAK